MATRGKKAAKGAKVAAKDQKWCHTQGAITTVYAGSTGNKAVAHLLMGEWVKPLGPADERAKRREVYYRGGKGFLDSAALLGARCLEIFFIDVGQGDAILIQTPEDRRILIDGGKGDAALRFLDDKYRLDKYDNFIDFDAVIATHLDDDHVSGLIRVLNHRKIAVRAFYHNGLFRRKDKKADPGPHGDGFVSGLADDPRGLKNVTDLMGSLARALDAAEKRLPKLAKNKKAKDDFIARLGDAPSFTVKRLDAAMGYLPAFGPGGDFRVEVLWPKARREGNELVYRWYGGDAGKTVNGNSVVLRVLYGTAAVLLSGDINREAMEDFLAEHGGRDITADVYKAAHHGSQDFSQAFLERVKPNAGIISSGDDRNDVYGHPRAVLVGSIVRESRSTTPAVFCTELAACYRPLSEVERAKFRSDKTGVQLYEKSIQGVIHFRCRPDKYYVGAVYNKTAIKDRPGKFNWKWDVWPDPRREAPGASP